MANPTITVTRKDNGVAEYKFTDGSKTITGRGFWDDATPWASGDYKASYWLFGKTVSSFRFGTPTNPDPIPNRKSIVFHFGTNTGNTEGCLVDADDFVGRVYTYLRGKDLAPEYLNMLANRGVNDYYNKNWNPIDIKVEGDFSYDVQLSINGGKSSYTEGDTILLEISLTDPGAANGLSKDVWFHLNFSGTGSLKSDLKSNNLANLPSKAGNSGLKNDSQWVKLSAGQQKVTVALNSIFDDLEEKTENFNVTIDDYAIRRESNLSGVVFYKSEGTFPINGSNDSINFELKDQEEIFDKLIQSGGQGNFTFTAPVAPKQIISGQFSSYSIPDRLIIKDGNTTLLDTGSVSVTGKPIDFKIPDNSAGNITVTVEAPLGGTAWDFSLSSGGFAPKNQRLLNNFSPLSLEEPEPLAITSEAKAIQPESVINTDNSSILTEGEVYLEVQAIQSEWVVNTYTSSILTEGKIYDTGQATRFTINRNGDTNQTEEIGWRVKPTGDSPISANDFESGTLPEGILTLLLNVQTTIDINFERLDTTGLSQEVLDAIGPINDYWGLKQDGLQEGEETWTIELFDPSTGNIIPASFNGNSLFSVRDDFFFVEPETGTDDGELLEGDNLSNIIFGSGGDDTINGNTGNDTLYGDNGDDIINGGIGDDIIDGGFGNDTIDGGTGNDTLRISRPQSKIALTKQSNNSYLLEDLSDVSFGIDVLKSIETIEFSDETIQLDTNNPPTVEQPIIDQKATEDIAFSFILPENTFADIDNDMLIYSATLENDNPLPSWLTFNTATRTFSGTPTNSEIGSLNIKVTATDNDGLIAIDTFLLIVEQNNTSPSFKLAKIADDIFNIFNSSGKSKLQVTLTEQSSNLVNELGVFTVDDAQGNINGIAPGSAGYAQAALDRAKVIFSAIANLPNGFDPKTLSRSLEFNSGDNLRFLLIKNNTLDNVRKKNTSNPDILFSNATTQKITDSGTGNFTLAWEDGNGSSDFKDFVVNIEATDTPLPLGANLQDQQQGEVLDLSSVGSTKTVQANFVVNREAAYNNFVGFYKITDSQGTITDPLTGVSLKPGDTGYTEAAITNRVAGIDLQTANQSTTTIDGVFQGGSIFAPFMIANGSVNQLLDADKSNDPSVYFAYLGANSDGVDHIRLLGNNTFGFEDLRGGGDLDYNDMIIKVNLSVI